MRIRNSKGRILRIRPGQLANFSGGAGYMPFILIFSLPASILFGIISSLILQRRAKRSLEQDDNPRTELYDFGQYAFLHTIVCIIIAVIAGFSLFFFGETMVYGNKADYAWKTVVLAFGPFAAWLLSTRLLIWLIERRGAEPTNLAIAAAAHVLLLVPCIPVFLFA